MIGNASARASVLDDSALVERVARDDHGAFETLMRRHNSRLFRVARAILRDDVEAEDALQDAYLDAYRHISQFRGGARLSTWLTRIVINHALLRLRRRRRDPVVVPFGKPWAVEPGVESGWTEVDVADEPSKSPSEVLLQGEIRRLLERRIDTLPVAFRVVFVMRDVEDMSVQETAECLSIPAATVRTRLFRARALLREALARDLDPATAGVFGFGGERCDRIVAGVLARCRVIAHGNVPPGAVI
jgi:RNA polymerase sigma-70 factor (ECF subfamily)